MNQALLKVQIGPVQDFIAQARSTRDLWSGSYLLSWIIAAGIRKLVAKGGELVFPNSSGQPLLANSESWRDLADHTALLTPNLPNLFVAKIPSTGDKKLAGEIQQAIEVEWKAICDAVWHHQDFIAPDQHERFEDQVRRFLSISWQITPLSEDGYATAYQQNGLQLDATRQTRDFKAWSTGAAKIGIASNKDSLSGKEESIEGGPGFAKRIKSRYDFLFKHDDWIGAITLVKRSWHLAYLNQDPRRLKTSSKEFPIFSTRAIAAKSTELDDEENVETAAGEKYFAVLALDGDQIGKWLNGEFLDPKDKLASHHAGFSAALSNFALAKVRPAVLERGGFLVYAGGDDVLALLPADQVLKCAQELRDAFQKTTENIKGRNGERLDASVGIAIAHFKSPLQDAIRSAQAAEKRAKNQLGRSAVAVSLFKRSGETIEWGSKWDSGGLKLYEAIASALDVGQLSSKFPHRAVELLKPYQTSGRQEDASAFDAVAVIQKDFAHAVSQQSTSGQATIVWATLEPKLENYLANLASDWDKSKVEGKQPAESKCQRILGSLIGLCQTVAFAHRTRATDGESKTQNSTPETEVAILVER